VTVFEALTYTEHTGKSRIFMDATRILDGKPVFFKRLRHEEELAIARQLSSESLASDPRNHSTPLLDVLELPEGGGKVMVTPFLRPWYNPDWESVGEAVSFFHQIFEVCFVYC
jgi:hypothetical protein